MVRAGGCAAASAEASETAAVVDYPNSIDQGCLDGDRQGGASSASHLATDQ
jgi:hypothetical protein